jgi:hypothetical protein
MAALIGCFDYEINNLKEKKRIIGIPGGCAWHFHSQPE